MYEIIQPDQRFRSKYSDKERLSLQTNFNLISYILIAFRKYNVTWVLIRGQKLSSLRDKKHPERAHTQIYVVDTHILLVACSSDWRWRTCYERTEVNMFGNGELLQCVTTDGAYITVSHVINNKNNKETTVSLIPDLLLCCLGNV